MDYSFQRTLSLYQSFELLYIVSIMSWYYLFTVWKVALFIRNSFHESFNWVKFCTPLLRIIFNVNYMCCLYFTVSVSCHQSFRIHFISCTFCTVYMKHLLCNDWAQMCIGGLVISLKFIYLHVPKIIWSESVSFKHVQYMYTQRDIMAEFGYTAI